MKKLLPLITFLLLAAALLSACSKPTVLTGDSCRGFSRNTWHSFVSYDLPTCWRTVDTDVLTMSNQTNTAQVTFQTTAPEAALTPAATYPLSTGETLYVLATQPDDEETQDLLDSIKILSFNIAPSSCEAPDYDYAQSINYTWQGITFGLPFCWGAEESHPLNSDFQLTLYRQEGEGKYTSVSFWSKSPLNDNYTQQADTTLSGLAAETYVYPGVEGTTDNLTVYVLASTPVWYIQTNRADDYNVQLILNTLTFTQP